MTTIAEIVKAFRLKDEDAIISLAQFDYAELQELQKRILPDYFATRDSYYSHRIHLIDKAITFKRNNEEIPYTL